MYVQHTYVQREFSPMDSTRSETAGRSTPALSLVRAFLLVSACRLSPVLPPHTLMSVSQTLLSMHTSIFLFSPSLSAPTNPSNVVLIGLWPFPPPPTHTQHTRHMQG
ncbi:uncharacterized protein K489DRAFT_7198 [Dissoconium aciculare CBS 342.82]|uniref:Uncharacterized protein n=1 Tax=Dissoconium aciculare CBS 342.82 TaxID=1314786 RepID=A0A6J3MGP0_9PEZI|nr:uncharacterized protein K489DRAFT_7198 [Dissoconium aciculare CBS 342.82]KAF1827126.1 hypothetical protein K489DRAFT_7198 [Dissoconium aciculare CBS 342.82]